MEENIKITDIQTVESMVEEKPKVKKKSIFKTKDCEIIKFNPQTKTLDVRFDGIGLRFNAVKNDYTGVETAKIKYKGTIGKPKFVYKLDE